MGLKIHYQRKTITFSAKKMSRTEEFDWIFDYSLQFLESDKFDAALMDFVDEKCLVFEDADENKLIYTEIHREFCDHVEALISSNLSELGITTELFLESCEKARNGRDINATVFERLTAMEDFQTFKKLMTKRNTELQLEAIRSFKVNTPLPTKSKRASKRSEEKKSEGKSETNSPVRFQSKDEDTGLTEAEREELRALQQSYEMSYGDYDHLPEEDVSLTSPNHPQLSFLHPMYIDSGVIIPKSDRNGAFTSPRRT